MLSPESSSCLTGMAANTTDLPRQHTATVLYQPTAVVIRALVKPPVPQEFPSGPTPAYTFSSFSKMQSNKQKWSRNSQGLANNKDTNFTAWCRVFPGVFTGAI